MLCHAMLLVCSIHVADWALGERLLLCSPGMICCLIYLWQARVTQLDKDLKATAQRKEQLDHETLKINQDLEAMVSFSWQTHSLAHLARIWLKLHVLFTSICRSN